MLLFLIVICYNNLSHYKHKIIKFSNCIYEIVFVSHYSILIHNMFSYNYSMINYVYCIYWVLCFHGISNFSHLSPD